MGSSYRENPLISTSKSSDTHLHVQLHPLVILTISDYITRHTLRQQHGPIVGAILGTQHGRDVIMEHAFECKLEEAVSDGQAALDGQWFHDRLQQFKDVHKAAALDLVGWFTLSSPDGPQWHHLPIHQHLSSIYNESIMLLLFHPSSVVDATTKGGKLPLTIYEPVYEASTADDGDRSMHAVGEGGNLSWRFQELPYSIETGEVEMISIDSVAVHGSNAAAAVEDARAEAQASANDKGKGKANAEDVQVENKSRTNAKQRGNLLSSEDESHIASLTAKANAIRMLQQRISLIKSYLAALPPCYLTHPSPQDLDSAAVQTIPTDINLPHSVLRQISSLLARLPLLNTTSTQETVSTVQSSDVALTSLLSSMGNAVSLTQRMGRKAGIYESAKAQKEQQKNRLDWESGRTEGHGHTQASFGTSTGMRIENGGQGARGRRHEASNELHESWQDQQYEEMDEA